MYTFLAILTSVCVIIFVIHFLIEKALKNKVLKVRLVQTTEPGELDQKLVLVNDYGEEIGEVLLATLSESGDDLLKKLKERTNKIIAFFNRSDYFKKADSNDVVYSLNEKYIFYPITFKTFKLIKKDKILKYILSENVESLM